MAKKFSAPKAIANHPGVQECLDGPTEGFDDYRYDVCLKAGWLFKSGRMEGCRSGRFNNVADFRHAEPTKIDGGPANG